MDKDHGKRIKVSLREDHKKGGQGKNFAWAEPLLLLGIMAGGFALSRHLGLWQFFTNQERLFQFLDSMGMWDETVFVILEALQVIIPSIPGIFLNVLGGYLYGTVGGVILSTIGTTIGGYIVFLLSRRFGRLFVSKFFSKYLMKRFGNIPHNKGRFTIFLLFLIPGVPKDYLCYTLGYLSTTEFLAITGIGRLLGTVLETLGGDYIRHKQYQKLFVLAGIGLVVIFLVLVFKKSFEDMLRRLHIIGYRIKKAGLLKLK